MENENIEKENIEKENLENENMQNENIIKKPSKLYSIIIYAISIYFFIFLCFLLSLFTNHNLKILTIIGKSLIAQKIVYYNIAGLLYFPFIILLGFSIHFYRKTVKSGGRKIFGIIPLLLTLVILAFKWYILWIIYLMCNLSI